MGKQRVNPQDISQHFSGSSRYLKVSETYIDDALLKFRPHVLEKSKSTASNLITACQQLKQHNIRRDSTVMLFKNYKYNFVKQEIKIIFFLQDSNSNELSESSENVSKSAANLSPTIETSNNNNRNSKNNHNNNNNNNSHNANNKDQKQMPKRANAAQEIMRNRAMSTGNVLTLRRDSASKASDEQNRTMLFQVL